MMNMLDLFKYIVLGRPNPLRFKVGDLVSFPSESFRKFTESGNAFVHGKIIEVDQGRREIPNYYKIESEDFIDHKLRPLPVLVCVCKIILTECFRIFPINSNDIA